MYSMVSMWEEGSFSSHQEEEYENLKMIELHPGVLLRHMCNKWKSKSRGPLGPDFWASCLDPGPTGPSGYWTPNPIPDPDPQDPT